MSLGIPLSQLITDNPDPLHTGIQELDQALNDGFQNRSIYEVYGPPGIGKTTLGKELIKNATIRNSDDKVLWIETFVPVSLEFEEENVYKVRITRFTELLTFFGNLLKDKDKYELIIIDGFAQLLVNHLNILIAHGVDRSIHELKCKDLTLLFTAMTKYTHSQNSTIVLLNSCMNTSYQQDLGSYEESFEVIDDGMNFFVSSTTILGNNQDTHGIPQTQRSKRRNVQVLKSSLIANSGMGTRDSRWEIFLKARIGIFFNWDDTVKGHRRGRIAIVHIDPGNESSSGRRNAAIMVEGEKQIQVVRFEYCAGDVVPMVLSPVVVTDSEEEDAVE